jgi:hypothetical protein
MKYMEQNTAIINQNEIISRIYTIRGQKVMLDRDLAELYMVETRQLTRQVRRNIDRFPLDFAFILTKEEDENLKSQIGTSSWGGVRRLPFAFTEYGIIMLSSVLNSKKAVQVNIQIMRTFIRLKKVLNSNELIYQRLEKIERKIVEHDLSIDRVFEAIELMLDQPKKRVKDIGFINPEKKPQFLAK